MDFFILGLCLCKHYPLFGRSNVFPRRARLSKIELTFFVRLSVSLSVHLSVCLPDLLATLKDPRRVTDQDKIACELWLGVQWLLVGADCEIVGLL